MRYAIGGPLDRPVVAVEDSAAVLAVPGVGEAALTTAERERAGVFRDERQRRDFVAAHLLVRHCVASLTGIAPQSVELRQYCPECRSHGHGKPFLPRFPEWHVSLSHCPGTVAAAVSETAVGVDIEKTVTFSLGPVEQKMMDHVLRPAESAAVRASAEPEKAFLRQWVRKEALVKAGVGSLRTMDEIDLSAVPLHPSGTARFEDWHLLDWTDDRTHVVGAAVAVAPPVLSRLLP